MPPPVNISTEEMLSHASDPIHRFGGYDQLQLVELPLPQPTAGEVLVQMRMAGVSPLDNAIRIDETHEATEQPDRWRGVCRLHRKGKWPMHYQDYSCLRMRVAGGVAFVTIDHPPTNLFGHTLVDELDRFNQEVARDDKVHVVVFDSADDEHM